MGEGWSSVRNHSMPPEATTSSFPSIHITKTRQPWLLLPVPRQHCSTLHLTQQPPPHAWAFCTNLSCPSPPLVPNLPPTHSSAPTHLAGLQRVPLAADEHLVVALHAAHNLQAGSGPRGGERGLSSKAGAREPAGSRSWGGEEKRAWAGNPDCKRCFGPTSAVAH